MPPARPASCISAHAYSAASRWHRAREAGGTFLLRIEDIDIRRCRREYETAILADLHWLGLDWDGEVRRQSEHFADYGQALDQLDARGLIYPCFCTRADIAAATGRAARPLHGPDGPLYPGTCRHLSRAERRAAPRGGRGALPAARCGDARRREAGPTHFFDETRGRIEGQPLLFGDFVLARKDTPTSYHLSVTVDDHLQGVTLVTRGEDLLPSTHVHGLLQKLLGYADAALRPPQAADRRRRAGASPSATATLTIRAMRESGMTPRGSSHRRAALAAAASQA